MKRWTAGAITLLTMLCLWSPTVAAGSIIFGNNPDPCSGAGNSAGCQANGSRQTIIKPLNGAINVLSIIGGAVAVIFVIVGGFQLIVSNGDASKIESARSTIIYAFVGIFIIVIARTIIVFVLGNV